MIAHTESTPLSGCWGRQGVGARRGAAPSPTPRKASRQRGEGSLFPGDGAFVIYPAHPTTNALDERVAPSHELSRTVPAGPTPAGSSTRGGRVGRGALRVRTDRLIVERPEGSTPRSPQASATGVSAALSLPTTGIEQVSCKVPSRQKRTEGIQPPPCHLVWITISTSSAPRSWGCSRRGRGALFRRSRHRISSRCWTRPASNGRSSSRSRISSEVPP